MTELNQLSHRDMAVGLVKLDRKEVQDNDLLLHNVGRDYTFECKTRKSVINITLSRNFKLKIDDWRVCKAFRPQYHQI